MMYRDLFFYKIAIKILAAFIFLIDIPPRLLDHGERFWMSIEEVRKKIYGIRKYVVACPVFPDNSPGWYNEVMDDIDQILNWIEFDTKTITQLAREEDKVACDEKIVGYKYYKDSERI